MPRHSPCALYSLTYLEIFGSLIVELCRQSQILLRKIVIVTLFFNRSVPQLKIHNFLPDLIWKTSLLPCFSSHLIHCSVFKVQFPVSFETRCKRSISWTLSSILKSPQAWIVLVEIVGIEPATSCLQGRRSPSWAISPYHLHLKKSGGPEWARTTYLTIISRTL